VNVEQQLIADTVALMITPNANVQQVKDYYVREGYLKVNDTADGAAERVCTRQEEIALYYHPIPYLIRQEETVGNVIGVSN